jgi:hypothetical protein
MELLNAIGASLLSTILCKLGSKVYRRKKTTKHKTKTDRFYMIHDSMSSKEIEDKMFNGFGKPYHL